MRYLPLVVLAWNALYFQWRMLSLCVLPDGAAVLMVDVPRLGLPCWLLAALPFTCMCPLACENVLGHFTALSGSSPHLDPAWMPEGTTCSHHTKIRKSARPKHSGPMTPITASIDNFYTLLKNEQSSNLKNLIS